MTWVERKSFLSAQKLCFIQLGSNTLTNTFIMLKERRLRLNLPNCLPLSCWICITVCHWRVEASVIGRDLTSFSQATPLENVSHAAVAVLDYCNWGGQAGALMLLGGRLTFVVMISFSHFSFENKFRLKLLWFGEISFQIKGVQWGGQVCTGALDPPRTTPGTECLNITEVARFLSVLSFW